MSMTSTLTPYEDQRRRLRLMEKVEAIFAPIDVARRKVARATAETPAQLVNIRKGKPKDLYGSRRERIDAAYVAWAQRWIGALHDDIRLAHARAGGVDPGLVAKAQASIDALEALVAEAHRAGVPMPEQRDGDAVEGRGPA